MEISKPKQQQGEPKIICQEESNILRVKQVLIQGRRHVTILRKNNTVQLYRINANFNSQKIKEWKACIVCSRNDKVIEIGILDERYLFTCSYEGKFVIIDLINDDDDSSFKKYSIQSAITSIKVTYNRKLKQVTVIIGNKTGGLKSYDITIDKDYYDPEFSDNMSLLDIRNSIEPHQQQVNYIQNLNQIRLLLGRRHTIINKEKLSPQFEAEQVSESESEKTIWVVSIETSVKYIITGTEFGYIIIYEKGNKEAIKRFKVSRFPIIGLQFIGNKLIYNDLISNIGILDLRTFTLTKFSFNFGVIEHSQIVGNKRINNFQIFALTVEGVLKIVDVNPIKNTLELVKTIRLDDSLEYFHIFC